MKNRMTSLGFLGILSLVVGGLVYVNRLPSDSMGEVSDGTLTLWDTGPTGWPGPGEGKAFSLPQSPEIRWSPPNSDYSVLAGWDPQRHRVTMLWEHLRIEGDQFYSGQKEWFTTEEIFPTRFAPYGIIPLRGTSSVVVWGQSTRNRLVVELWKFGVAGIESTGIVPGTQNEVIDLAVMDSGPIRGSDIFYDVANEDSITGFGSPVTLLFMVTGDQSIYSIDLSSLGGDVMEIAGPGPIVISPGQPPKPTHLVPELSDDSYGFICSGHSVFAGQILLLADGPLTEGFVVVSDYDLDGHPETVQSVTKALVDAFSLLLPTGGQEGYIVDYSDKYF